MTDWIAPVVTRVDEPVTGDERAMLEGWLDWHRQTLLTKCTGLTAEQLKLRSVEPSTLSLLGLVRHMHDVERGWFRESAAGQPVTAAYSSADNLDGEFDDVDSADAAADHAAFLAEIEVVRAAVAALPLEHEFVNRHGRTMSLRWVFLHMIEEYARHNGHADLLRERIDGATGD